jgi:hypothetical protein
LTGLFAAWLKGVREQLIYALKVIGGGITIGRRILGQTLAAGDCKSANAP